MKLDLRVTQLRFSYLIGVQSGWLSLNRFDRRTFRVADDVTYLTSTAAAINVEDF